MEPLTFTPRITRAWSAALPVSLKGFSRAQTKTKTPLATTSPPHTPSEKGLHSHPLNSTTPDSPTKQLARILAIPIPDTKPPKPPGYLNCGALQPIRSMTCFTPSHQPPTDAEMIISLIQHAIIPDPGYTWADASHLHHWLCDELTKRLNFFYDAEAGKSLAEKGAVPILLRDMKRPSAQLALDVNELVRWSRREQQRKIKFCATGGMLTRLKRVDLSRDLSVWQLVGLVGEERERVGREGLKD